MVIPASPCQKQMASKIIFSFGEAVQIIVHYNCGLCDSYYQQGLSTEDGMYDTTQGRRGKSFHRAQAPICDKWTILYTTISKK